MDEDPVCTAIGIPAHLHSTGRKIVTDFEPTEVLYRRYPFSTPDITQTFNFKQMSMNRGMFSSPEDVLFDHEKGGRRDHCGVVAIEVRHLLDIIKTDDAGNQYQFGVDHTPDRCNYAHVDVSSLKTSGERQEPVKFSPSMRLKFREALHGLVTIALPASDAGKPFPLKIPSH